MCLKTITKGHAFFARIVSYLMSSSVKLCSALKEVRKRCRVGIESSRLFFY